MAAGPDVDRTVTGSLTLFPGSSLDYVQPTKGFSMAFRPGWAGLAVGVLVRVAAARPWRVQTGRAREHHDLILA